MKLNNTDDNSEKIRIPPKLYTLTIDKQIEYSERLIEEVASNFWGDTFSDIDKRNLEIASSRILSSVKRTQKLALNILDSD